MQICPQFGPYLSVVLILPHPTQECVNFITNDFNTLRGVDMAEFLVTDPAVQDAHPHTQYDLIANICHEGEPGKGTRTY